MPEAEFPIYRKSIATGVIVKFISSNSGYVIGSTNAVTLSVGTFSDNWVNYNDKTTWEPYTPPKEQIMNNNTVVI